MARNEGSSQCASTLNAFRLDAVSKKSLKASRWIVFLKWLL